MIAFTDKHQSTLILTMMASLGPVSRGLRQRVASRHSKPLVTLHGSMPPVVCIIVQKAHVLLVFISLNENRAWVKPHVIGWRMPLGMVLSSKQGIQ